MTPEERAEAAAEWWDGDYSNEPRRLLTIEAASEAIREAVAEQRERDAKIAESIEAQGDWCHNSEDGSYWESDWRKTVAEVARRIREDQS